MDKSFNTRVIVGLGIFFIAMLTIYTFQSIPFKILYALCVAMALLELLSFFSKKFTWQNLLLAVLQIIFLACGLIIVTKANVSVFWYFILGVVGYDVFAYLFGKLFGGKIFKKSRPFPHISKGKTWEGTILGILASALLVLVLLLSRGSFAQEWFCLFLGVFAMLGDLFESFLKRRFGVKDSGEILARHKFFQKIEALLGGANGHGGYLDRLDSISFSCAMLLLLIALS